MELEKEQFQKALLAGEIGMYASVVALASSRECYVEFAFLLLFLAFFINSYPNLFCGFVP